ncbi:hypothetical protein [Shewanella donghaensis]|uniref:hypothetical protein n=1 Tax=Shewanella donghaensis TaxID=238836 RepID=UPI001183BE3D|nr:hypothetical protein [Shewanella donghaensis]
MIKLTQKVFIVTTVFIISLSYSLSSYAHMMVAQHGTINIVDDGAFMVLSLPVSAFGDIDDNKDGGLSQEEFSRHKANIIEQVSKKAVLTSEHGKQLLEGIIVSRVKEHGSLKQPSTQLIVMGRYQLSATNEPLSFSLQLFGSQFIEQQIEITATKKGKLKHIFELNPQTVIQPLFLQMPQ